MKNITKTFLVLILLFSCSSPKPYREISNSSVDLVIDESTDTQDLIRILEERRYIIKNWALMCDGEYAGQASTEPGQCKQWDMIEFSGNGCLSAELAGDKETVNGRCRDVELGQSEDGRWWRGQSNLEKSKENSFSRDMMYGVINYFISQGVFSKDLQKRKEVKARAMNWIDWIEFSGQGKQMCNDNFTKYTNSCQIGRSRVLYHTFKRLNAINSANRNYKLIKSFKKGYGLNAWDIETKGTPPGYQLFLKSHKMYQYYFLKVINTKQYQKIAKIIYEKNPLNPWHEFMYLGATHKNIQRTIDLCPVNRPTKADWTVRHYSEGDFAWQRDTSDRAWEVASGHDCITLLNWQIADLKNKVSLPFIKPASSCGSKKEIGTYGSKKICKPRLFATTSSIKCSTKNGLVWKDGDENYCLEDQGKYYLAKKVKKECPTGNTSIGEHKGLPLCEKKYLQKIKLYNCNKKGAGEMHGTASDLITENGKITHCYVFNETWYQKRKVGDMCPVGTKYTGKLQGERYPICDSPFRIKRESCDKYDIRQENSCLVLMKGWYSERKYKTECPFATWDTKIEKDGKPLCKPFVHFKIKEKKCSKKGGEVYNGWCIWNKDDHYKARKLK